MKTRLLGMFSKKPSFEKKTLLTEDIANKLELLIIELSKRRQSSRTLEIIQSKEVNKLVSAIETGNISSSSLSTIADANVLWTALTNTLQGKEPIFSSDMTQKFASCGIDELQGLVTTLPTHHKRLVGLLIPMIECLGEDNIVVSEMMIKEIGKAVMSSLNIESSHDSESDTFKRMALYAPTLLPSSRDHLTLGIPDIQNRTAFWKSVMDGGDADEDSQSSMSHRRNEFAHRTNLLDRERQSMQERLGSNFDSDDDDSGMPNLGHMIAPEPSVPPTYVPLPSEPPPLHSTSNEGTTEKSRWESATKVKEQPAVNSLIPSELKIVFDKCRGSQSQEADISLFTKELRSCFGSSSTALRNELIAFIPQDEKTTSISWHEVEKIMASREMEGQRLSAIKPVTASEDSKRGSHMPIDSGVDVSHSHVARNISGPSFSGKLAGPSSRMGGNPCTTPVDSDRGTGSPASPFLGPTGTLQSAGGSASLALLDMDDTYSDSLTKRAAHNRFQAISSAGVNAGTSSSTAPRARHGMLIGGQDVSFDSEDGSLNAHMSSPLTRRNRDGKITSTLPSRKQRAAERSGSFDIDTVGSTESTKDVPLFLRPFEDSPVRKTHSDEVLDFSASSSPAKTPARGSRAQARNSGLDLDSSGESWNVPGRGLQQQRSAGTSVKGASAGNGEKRPGRRSRGTNYADGSTGKGVDFDASWDDSDEDSPFAKQRISDPQQQGKVHSLGGRKTPVRTSSAQQLLSLAVSNLASGKQLGSPGGVDRSSQFRRENSEASDIGRESPMTVNQRSNEAYVRVCLGDDSLLMQMDTSEPSTPLSPGSSGGDSPEKLNRRGGSRRNRAGGMFSLTALDTSQSSLDESFDIAALKNRQAGTQPKSNTAGTIDEEKTYSLVDSDDHKYILSDVAAAKDTQQTFMHDVDDVKCSTESKSTPLLGESTGVYDRPTDFKSNVSVDVNTRDKHGKLERQDTQDSSSSDIKDQTKPKRKSLKKTLSGVFSFMSSSSDVPEEASKKQESGVSDEHVAVGTEAKKEVSRRGLLRKMSSDSTELKQNAEVQAVGKSGLFSRSQSASRSLTARGSAEAQTTSSTSNWSRKGLKSLLGFGDKEDTNKREKSSSSLGDERQASRAALGRPRSSTLSTTDDEDSDDERGHFALKSVAAPPLAAVPPQRIGGASTSPTDELQSDDVKCAAPVTSQVPDAPADSTEDAASSNRQELVQLQPENRESSSNDGSVEDDDILTGLCDNAHTEFKHDSVEVDGRASKVPSTSEDTPLDTNTSPEEMLASKQDAGEDNSGNIDDQNKYLSGPPYQELCDHDVTIRSKSADDMQAPSVVHDPGVGIGRGASHASSRDLPQTPEGRNFKEIATQSNPVQSELASQDLTDVPSKKQNSVVESKAPLESTRPEASVPARAENIPYPVHSTSSSKKGDQPQSLPAPQRKSLSCQLPAMQTLLPSSAPDGDGLQDDPEDDESVAASVTRPVPVVKPMRAAVRDPDIRDEKKVGIDNWATQATASLQATRIENTGFDKTRPSRYSTNADDSLESFSARDRTVEHSHKTPPEQTIDRSAIRPDLVGSTNLRIRAASHHIEPPLPTEQYSASRAGTYRNSHNRPLTDHVVSGEAKGSPKNRVQHDNRPVQQDWSLPPPPPPSASQVALAFALQESRNHFLSSGKEASHEPHIRPDKSEHYSKNRTGLLLGDKVHDRMRARRMEEECRDNPLSSHDLVAPYPEAVLRVFPHMTPPPKTRTRSDPSHTSPRSPNIRILLDVHDSKSRHLSHKERVPATTTRAN